MEPPNVPSIQWRPYTSNARRCKALQTPHCSPRRRSQPQALGSRSLAREGNITVTRVHFSHAHARSSISLVLPIRVRNIGTHCSRGSRQRQCERQRGQVNASITSVASVADQQDPNPASDSPTSSERTRAGAGSGIDPRIQDPADVRSIARKFKGEGPSVGWKFPLQPI